MVKTATKESRAIATSYTWYLRNTKIKTNKIILKRTLKNKSYIPQPYNQNKIWYYKIISRPSKKTLWWSLFQKK
jgi:hypothetical protein